MDCFEYTYCCLREANQVGLLYANVVVFQPTKQVCRQLLRGNQDLHPFCTHMEDPSTRDNSRYARVHDEW